MKTPRCTCPDCRIDWLRVLLALTLLAACGAAWWFAIALAINAAALIGGWLS